MPQKGLNRFEATSRSAYADDRKPLLHRLQRFGNRLSRFWGCYFGWFLHTGVPAAELQKNNMGLYTSLQILSQITGRYFASAPVKAMFMA
jgi:hypothetical protein